MKNRSNGLCWLVCLFAVFAVRLKPVQVLSVAGYRELADLEWLLEISHRCLKKTFELVRVYGVDAAHRQCDKYGMATVRVPCDNGR